jgi:hypothetical protein
MKFGEYVITPEPVSVSFSILYCSNSWDSPTWRARSPKLYPPGTGGDQIYPRALGTLSVASYDSQGYGGCILTHLHTEISAIKVKVILRPTVSWPVRPDVKYPSGTRDQFFTLSLWIILDSCGFVDVGRPLWREVGSAVFSFCRASSAQPFSDLSLKGHMSTVCCHYYLDSSNLGGQSLCIWIPTTIARQLLGKNITAATNTQSAIIFF